MCRKKLKKLEENFLIFNNAFHIFKAFILRKNKREKIDLREKNYFITAKVMALW